MDVLEESENALSTRNSSSVVVADEALIFLELLCWVGKDSFLEVSRCFAFKETGMYWEAFVENGAEVNKDDWGTFLVDEEIEQREDDDLDELRERLDVVREELNRLGDWSIKVCDFAIRVEISR